MHLGIFARTFARPTIEDVFDAVRAHGLRCVQFNLSCAGVPSLPDEIAPALITHIREAAQSRDIEIAAVSGTYNMIHPDQEVQQRGLRRLRTLAAACQGLGTAIITLCTGTRDPVDMWQWHPENSSPQSWSDLLRAMEAALRIAEEEQVTLAFEPERANVVSTAAHGHALLAAMQSQRLKVVIDPANLVVPGDERPMSQVLDEAFDLLGEHIVIAHAKDRGADDTFRAAGEGILDFDHYLRLLQASSFPGPLIIHGLAEAQVDTALQFIYDKLQRR
ncbi:sugar phosphate isomerase/epimerase family protein [Dictyobacter formicarum]|uniref:Epimerase n=1 Tax=Dictyobacter formicarum TaxID=2778368 RepID=A0ABQ3V7T8_9CHLR|nr:sugar phosphate isomerase/epimerase [Dictyobacter formicarum]GHO82190.1 epimerase [Dictyobacter formicarum]